MPIDSNSIWYWSFHKQNQETFIYNWRSHKTDLHKIIMIALCLYLTCIFVQTRLCKIYLKFQWFNSLSNFSWFLWAQTFKKILENKLHCLLSINQQIKHGLNKAVCFTVQFENYVRTYPIELLNLTAPCRICINHSTLKKIMVLTGMSRHCTVIIHVGHCIVPVKCQIWKACTAILYVRYCLWL